MKLKKRITKLDEVPEQYRDLYSEDESNGGFVLDIQDAEGSKQIDEYRTNNRKLNKRVEELQAALQRFDPLKDIDPEGIKALLEAQKKQSQVQEDEVLRELVGKDGVLDKARLQAYVQRQFEGERNSFTRKLEGINKELAERDAKIKLQRDRLTAQTRQAKVRQAIEALGIPKPGAIDDILYRAERAISFDEEENLVVLDADGEPRYGKKGGDLMSVEDWATELIDTAPHLFEGPRGGGSKGNGEEHRRKQGIRSVNGNDPEDLGRNFKAIIAGEARISGE